MNSIESKRFSIQKYLPKNDQIPSHLSKYNTIACLDHSNVFIHKTLV